jgi:cell wall-associated NlpC family hydrolase
MKIADIALSWLNTPYHSMAKIKGVGVDCAQLLIGVYEEIGILPLGEIAPGAYTHDFHLHRSEEKYLYWVEKYCYKITAPKPGDIALFKFGRCISHGAIVLDWPLVIHAYVGYGVILSNYDDAILKDNCGKSRLFGLYRIRGM